MSKNKNQHYVPAFYLYNFTNQTQRTESFGKAKRDTKIYHYDFNKGCVRERPIEKVAIESYLLSYKNSDDVYNHDLDNEIQNVENVASKAISELNDIFLYALKKKPNHVEIKNSVMDSIIELLYWQMKRHPDIVAELEKECEQYLLEKKESPREAKRMAIEVIPICIQDDTVIYPRQGGAPWRDSYKSVVKTFNEPSSYGIRPQRLQIIAKPFP